jgi:hypothetical protein
MGVQRRGVVAAFASLFSGCVSVEANAVWEDERPATSDRPETAVRTRPSESNATTTPGPSTETATPTPTETPTPTGTPTPSRTPTPAPDDVVVEMSEWAEMETDGTTVGVRVMRYEVVEKVERAGGINPISPDDDDDVFLVTYVELRNLRTATTVGWPQWTMTDIEGAHSPYVKAMNQARNTLPEEHRLGATDDFVAGRVIFSTKYPQDVDWYVEPYGDNEGPTIHVVSD